MDALCASCTAELPEGAKFCGECGTPVAVRCAACGTPATKATQRFCVECGERLGGSASGSAVRGGGSALRGGRGDSAVPVSELPSAPAIERRLVSVLFADLTGFTAFSESRDAEDVREMLSGYFEAARRIVDSYGGHIEKFIGDAVMALWGAPVAQEDDAERAVRAALDLVAAVTGLGDRLGLELRLRAGVLTGEAAVELDAVAQGMVIGDAVNTASRIQTLAAPGSVLVDDVTRLATERAIAYEDAGAHVVKGKSKPVQTWRPLRVVALAGGGGRTMVEPPLVGRVDEMAAIRRGLESVLEPEAGLRLVSVVAEAGLGKSRLAWELEKYSDGLASTVLWHRGQASSFGQGVGFSALADMVRGRAEINLGDPADEQRTKLRVLIDDVFSAEDDRDSHRRVGRALGRLLGLDDGRDLIDRGELFSSWRQLFERLATREPVVLLFEDLHWADQGLFDFIAHLCEWAAASPILVLVFSRPNERLDTLAVLGERIDLAPLSSEDIEELVAQAVAGAPAELVSNVREHAAGVPLFAVESLRMLADRGLMVAEGESDRYRLIGEHQDLDVPPSIHALVAARLDSLGALERRVLLDAAVLGQRFSASVAAALVGIGERDVRSLLDGLVSKQFLTVNTDPLSPERGRYAFVHRQVQRVALGTMSKHARKARHLAAVEHLSRREADPDLAGILAGHLLAASEADPHAPDAAAIRLRALSMMLEAAERADGVGAVGEAIVLFDRAAEIEPDERERAVHLVHAARCAERLGEHESAAAARYASARELHEQAGRDREALRLRAREVYVYRWTRPASELIGALRDAYESLRSERDGAFADVAASLAGVLYADGDARAAEVIAAEAAEAAQSAGAYEELGLALNYRASALIELGRPVEALPVFRAALETREQYAPAEVPASMGNIAITLAALGRLEEAAATGREAMAAAERVASRVHRNLAALQLARSLFSLGRWDEALATVEGVAQDAAPAYQGMTIGPPVLVALHRGDTERARAVIADFDARQADSGAAFESDYRALRGVVLAQLDGDPDRAEAIVLGAESGDYAEWRTWLALAVDLLTTLADARPLHTALEALRGPVAPKTSPMVIAQMERLAAHIAARDGDLDEAVAHWHRARQTLSDAGMVFDAGVVALELAEHCPGDPAAGTGCREAIETFSRLNAAPWLARATAALTRAPAPAASLRGGASALSGPRQASAGDTDREGAAG